MYDLILKNGLILDGSGNAPFVGDVALKDGKIAAVGGSLPDAEEILDVSGLAVTPGFIDSHSHSDGALLKFPAMKEKLEQGITTCVGGQCGSSQAPKAVDGKIYTMGQFMQDTENSTFGCNHLLYVGHGTIRRAVMGNTNAQPTEAQLEEMKALVRDAMEHGALGLSYGLMYNPGCYSDTQELVELAKVVAEYDGVVSAHIRNEGDTVEEAFAEFLHVLRESGVRGIYSHHKACGKANHGKVHRTMAMLEQAVAEGVQVWSDAYPYIASSTSVISSFVDKKYRAGSPEDVVAALHDPAIRESQLKAIEGQWGNDLSWVLLTNCRKAPQFNGLTIGQVAELRGTTHAEAALDIVCMSPEKNSGCFFSMSEEDMCFVLAHERTMICTDSSVAGLLTIFHPRMRGSFPRVLGRYVRKKGLVTIQEMIRKMTSLPASVYRIPHKGRLEVGFDADICVFDPETICDTAEYTQPTLPNVGIQYVFVNGKLAVRDGAVTGTQVGRVLKA